MWKHKYNTKSCFKKRERNSRQSTVKAGEEEGRRSVRWSEVCVCVRCWGIVSVSRDGSPVFPGGLSVLLFSSFPSLPSLSLLSLFSCPVPPGLVEPVGPLRRSSSANLIGDRLPLAWHGDELPNPFSPSCSGLASRQRAALLTDAAAAAAVAGAAAVDAGRQADSLSRCVWILHQVLKPP